MAQQYKKHIKNKVFLITGGTGSFGMTVVGRLLSEDPKQIIVFSRDEKKQFDMRNIFDDKRLRFVIGDVREKESLDRVFEDIHIDYVFHAAALKQVPTAEFFPVEAVKTNILGAENVLQMALRYSVKKVVILSTDKAAYPINAMGMTKALMEKIMVAYSREYDHSSPRETVFCGVRYGNVLLSRGSVIPHFISLIKQGKVLPLTNARMTRFLLPLPDAIDLVLHAFIQGKNGHLYVRKAPAATIETVAQALCKIFKHTVGYKEMGVRAGEKMHETLLTVEEMERAHELTKYYEVPPESQGFDYNKYFIKGERITTKPIKPYTSENTKRLTVEETKKLLLGLPEIKQELKTYTVNIKNIDETVYSKI